MKSFRKIHFNQFPTGLLLAPLLVFQLVLAGCSKDEFTFSEESWEMSLVTSSCSLHNRASIERIGGELADEYVVDEIRNPSVTIPVGYSVKLGANQRLRSIEVNLEARPSIDEKAKQNKEGQWEQIENIATSSRLYSKAADEQKGLQEELSYNLSSKLANKMDSHVTARVSYTAEFLEIDPESGDETVCEAKFESESFGLFIIKKCRHDDSICVVRAFDINDERWDDEQWRQKIFSNRDRVVKAAEKSYFESKETQPRLYALPDLAAFTHLDERDSSDPTVFNAIDFTLPFFFEIDEGVEEFLLGFHDDEDLNSMTLLEKQSALQKRKRLVEQLDHKIAEVILVLRTGGADDTATEGGMFGGVEFGNIPPMYYHHNEQWLYRQYIDGIRRVDSLVEQDTSLYVNRAASDVDASQTCPTQMTYRYDSSGNPIMNSMGEHSYTTGKLNPFLALVTNFDGCYDHAVALMQKHAIQGEKCINFKQAAGRAPVCSYAFNIDKDLLWPGDSEKGIKAVDILKDHLVKMVEHPLMSIIPAEIGDDTALSNAYLVIRKRR